MTFFGRAAGERCLIFAVFFKNNFSKNITQEYFKNVSNILYITIPDDITKIDDYAFHNFVSLKNIIIPNSVVEIGEKAFLGCSSLKKITIPGTIPLFGTF